MRDFLTLVSYIFIITCIQIIGEMFISNTERPQTVKLLNIACFAGSLYLTMQFVFSKILTDLVAVIKFPF